VPTRTEHSHATVPLLPGPPRTLGGVTLQMEDLVGTSSTSPWLYQTTPFRKTPAPYQLLATDTPPVCLLPPLPVGIHEGVQGGT